MKETQDADVAPALHYVRFVGEIQQSLLDDDSGDEDEDAADRTKSFRVVICMSKQASYRLTKAQYLQCDIAFKRVVGFYEFELSGYDRDAKMGNSYHQSCGASMAYIPVRPSLLPSLHHTSDCCGAFIYLREH
jgi:hypothetical protein